MGWSGAGAGAGELSQSLASVERLSVLNNVRVLQELEEINLTLRDTHALVNVGASGKWVAHEESGAALPPLSPLCCRCLFAVSACRPVFGSWMMSGWAGRAMTRGGAGQPWAGGGQ